MTSCRKKIVANQVFFLTMSKFLSAFRVRSVVKWSKWSPVDTALRTNRSLSDFQIPYNIASSHWYWLNSKGERKNINSNVSVSLIELLSEKKWYDTIFFFLQLIIHMYWSQLFALQDAIFYTAATSKCIALYISKIMLLF